MLTIRIFGLKITFFKNPKKTTERNKAEYKKAQYIDENGYYRYTKNKKLVHRDIAFKEIYIYNRKRYPARFRNYIVHHIDGNKQNNEVYNLCILTAEFHKKIHHYRGLYVPEHNPYSYKRNK